MIGFQQWLLEEEHDKYLMWAIGVLGRQKLTPKQIALKMAGMGYQVNTNFVRSVLVAARKSSEFPGFDPAAINPPPIEPRPSAPFGLGTGGGRRVMNKPEEEDLDHDPDMGKLSIKTPMDLLTIPQHDGEQDHINADLAARRSAARPRSR